jgi:hypothetical protein
VFKLVSLLQHLWSFIDSKKGQERYMYLVNHSSDSISLDIPPGHVQCWFVGVSDLLELVGISMDHIPLFEYSLDAPAHLLPRRKELNRIIRDDIYKQFE